jgi:hypothetical protein
MDVCPKNIEHHPGFCVPNMGKLPEKCRHKPYAHTHIYNKLATYYIIYMI